MRYVPNLIPEEFRVLPGYFKGDIYKQQTNKLVLAIYWVLAVFFFFSALVFITHPLLAIVLALIGFILMPLGSAWLEKQLRFQLTAKIKGVFVGILFIASLPLQNYYHVQDIKEAGEARIRKENEEKQKLAEEKKEQQRKDSLQYYLQQAAHLQKQARYDNALTTLVLASSFSGGVIDAQQINRMKESIGLQKILLLVKKGAYKEAIPQLSLYLESGGNNAELLYQRAVCYSKIGRTEEAVADLRTAMDLGSDKAETLHNKINPLRKKIIGYTTLCCDGSTSSARGRGACSWHGGVCNWNYPVYEEYRKY